MASGVNGERWSVDSALRKQPSAISKQPWHALCSTATTGKPPLTQDQAQEANTSLLRCRAAYGGTALAFRDLLVIAWNKTQQHQTFADQKRVYCVFAPPNRHWRSSLR